MQMRFAFGKDCVLVTVVSTTEDYNHDKYVPDE